LGSDTNSITFALPKWKKAGKLNQLDLVV